MGDLVVTEFVSMDGVMQAPGGEEFKYEGWSFDFERGDDGDEFKASELFDSEAQILGRVTYESFAGAWPERESMPGRWGEFAKWMNEMPKYVISSTLEDPEWTNVTVIDGGADVPAESPRSRTSTRARSSSRGAACSSRPCSRTTSSTACA